jgi:hypothetical protein
MTNIFIFDIIKVYFTSQQQMFRNAHHKRWTEQEKEILKELYFKYGEKCCNFVPKYIEGRKKCDAKQVLRYHLNGQTSKEPFSEEE